MLVLVSAHGHFPKLGRVPILFIGAPSFWETTIYGFLEK